MDKIPSGALCAHVHDSMFGRDVSQKQIDAFVSGIYSHCYTIPLCKEIAQLAKSRVSNMTPDLGEFHHLPLRRDKGNIVTDKEGYPYLNGRQWFILNDLIHSEQSEDRDKALILMTKLHAYVKPLSVYEGVRQVEPMLTNITSPHSYPSDIDDMFRDKVKSYLDRIKWINDYDWHEHLAPLHDLAAQYYGSDKKASYYTYKDGSMQYEEGTLNDMHSYILPCILSNDKIRRIYLDNKIDFLTLTTGLIPDSVIDDSDALASVPSDLPIGRMGIRLQEAEKVRILWMPLPVFKSLVKPVTDLLEKLVKQSAHQSTYSDDYSFACKVQKEFFNGSPSAEPIYSIDQTAFTDNFPYKLQRILLEELVARNVVPSTSLLAFDLQVTGKYRPARVFNKTHPDDVTFAKGTPMGAEACFMLATLSHELIIDAMFDKHMIPYRHRHYCVQGDDALIKGTDVYNDYYHTLMSLGAEINTSKTLVSNAAVEYCGFITTYQQTVPMYRPHDRYTDHVRDLVSDRAQEAFGLSQLVEWISNERPDDITTLQIIGLIPIYEDDTLVADAYSVCRALSISSTLTAPGITPEHIQRMYATKEYYPVVDLSDENIKLIRHPVRSDYDEYQRKLTKLIRLRYNLEKDPHCDLTKTANEIITLSSDIKITHSDYVSALHPPMKGVMKHEEGNPFKPKNRISRDLERTAHLSLDIVTKRRLPTIEGKEENTNDEPHFA